VQFLTVQWFLKKNFNESDCELVQGIYNVGIHLKGLGSAVLPPPDESVWCVMVVRKKYYQQYNNNNNIENIQTSHENIFWNQQQKNDRTIPNNKTDIIIRDKEKGTRVLIDVAI